jgi:hypothetical protein
VPQDQSKWAEDCSGYEAICGLSNRAKLWLVPKLVVAVWLLEEANVKLADRDMFVFLENTKCKSFLFGAEM